MALRLVGMPTGVPVTGKQVTIGGRLAMLLSVRLAGGGLEGGWREPAVVMPDDLARGGDQDEPRLVLDAVAVGQPAAGVQRDRVGQRPPEAPQEGSRRVRRWLGGCLVDGQQLRQPTAPGNLLVAIQGVAAGAPRRR